ncbi:hypothetical protein V6N13_028428 [Hibiscus sabdariffa]|uniref:Uncharacterized protein n=1 Tax=Hibiscus sabdariffa TaxID=183260 RepID=A0ABR2DAF9_9ROSI
MVETKSRGSSSESKEYDRETRSQPNSLIKECSEKSLEKGDDKLKENLEEIEKVMEEDERNTSEGGKEDRLDSLKEKSRINLSPNYSWVEVVRREIKEKNKTEENIRADVVALGFAKNEIHILEEDPNLDMEECFDSIK